MPTVRSHVRAVAVLVALLSLVLAACAPRAQTFDAPTGSEPEHAPSAAAFDTPAARDAERAAYEAYHLMELGRLRLGVYTTNVLVDLDLPRGARITVEAFGDHADDYRLRLTSDAATDIAWLVTPLGVRRVAH